MIVIIIAHASDYTEVCVSVCVLGRLGLAEGNGKHEVTNNDNLYFQQ